MAAWMGSGLIWPRRYLFVGMGDKSDEHETHATIICVAIDEDKSFKLRVKDTHGEKSYQAVIIAPDVSHEKICREAGVIILLYLMPETDEAYQIRNKYLHNSCIVGVPQNLMDALLPQLSEYHLDKYREIRNLKKKQAKALCEELDCEQAEALCEKVISALGISPSTELSEDLEAPVKVAIEVMDKKVSGGAKAAELKVDEIAREVERILGNKPKHLGEDFLDQVKVTMSHYKVGLGLRETFRNIETGDSLRRLAKRIYFTDSPALSNACRDWLGVRPSHISRYSYFRSCPK